MPAEKTGGEEPHESNCRPRSYNEQPSSPDFSSLINAYANEQKSNREQEQGEYRKNLFISILTLLFLVLTTGGVFIQAFILNSTDKAVEKQIRISVRPWVGLSDEAVAIQTTGLRFDQEDNAVVSYQIISKNFSSSAAKNVWANAFLVVSEDLALVYKKADEACGDNYVGKIDIGSVLFPGKFANMIQSGSLVRKSEIIPGPDGKVEAWLVGCIGYRDQFEVLYKTRFYYWYVDPITNRAFTFVPAAANSEIPGHFVEHHSSVE